MYENRGILAILVSIAKYPRRIVKNDVAVSSVAAASGATTKTTGMFCMHVGVGIVGR